MTVTSGPRYGVMLFRLAAAVVGAVVAAGAAERVSSRAGELQSGSARPPLRFVDTPGHVDSNTTPFCNVSGFVGQLIAGDDGCCGQWVSALNIVVWFNLLDWLVRGFFRNWCAISGKAPGLSTNPERTIHDSPRFILAGVA